MQLLYILAVLCVACRTWAPQPGIESMPSPVEVHSPNHWTTREFPKCSYYFFYQWQQISVEDAFKTYCAMCYKVLVKLIYETKIETHIQCQVHWVALNKCPFSPVNVFVARCDFLYLLESYWPRDIPPLNSYRIYSLYLSLTLLIYHPIVQWHPTPVLLPGKSHGRRSLVGCSPWGR